MGKADASVFDRSRVILFIVLSYGISWLSWIPNVISYNFNVGWAHSNWLHIFGGLGPLIGAIITTFILEKGQGLRKYFRERFLQLPSFKWMSIGFLMPILFFLLAYVFLGIFTGEWTDLTELGLNSKVPMTNIFIIWILWCFFYGVGEESGWRGFLTPELIKKYNTRISTLYTAFVWAPWHLPIFFYDKDFITMGLGGTVGWIVGLVFGSFLLGWLVKQSNWNLLPVILWHGTYNFFTTSDRINPLFPVIMSMMIIVVVLWIARKYDDNFSLVSSISS